MRLRMPRKRDIAERPRHGLQKGRELSLQYETTRKFQLIHARLSITDGSVKVPECHNGNVNTKQRQSKTVSHAMPPSPRRCLQGTLSQLKEVAVDTLNYSMTVCNP